MRAVTAISGFRRLTSPLKPETRLRARIYHSSKKDQQANQVSKLTDLPNVRIKHDALNSQAAPHCELCCAENREALRAQKRSAQRRKGGLASGAAAKRRKNERRRKVSKLTQSSMNATDIAQQLKVSHSTIKSDLHAIKEQTRAARETNQRTWQARQLTMQELQSQGLTEHEIAQKMERNVRTIRNHLKAMQKTRED